LTSVVNESSVTSSATQSTVEASADESPMEQMVDLTSTANQSDSVEVSECASKQDIDLTSRTNSDILSEEWHVTVDSTQQSSVETSCSSFPVTPEQSKGAELPEKFHPPRTYKFPKRKFGTAFMTERCFQSSWYDKYKWLHYDKGQDRAFCYLCMKAEKEGKFLSSHRREPTFITSGFTNWKEATKCFNKHQSSACHGEAVEALCLLPEQIMGHVDDLMSTDINQQKATNRKMLIKILQNVKYLARQGLPFRGHDDSNGNFIQLMLL